MPIISVTDKSTDVGKIAEENNYGFSCVNSDVNSFTRSVNKLLSSPNLVLEMGQNAYNYLCKNYLVDNTYDKIIKHI